jgi:hypothetical protein
MPPGNNINAPDSTLTQEEMPARLPTMATDPELTKNLPAFTRVPSPSTLKMASVMPIASATVRQPALTTPSAILCDRAAPGNPIDITIPDDTLLKPGQSFSKTWRLVNMGNCTWDHQYSVVFFSGDLLSAPRTNVLSETVIPYQSVDITVDMVAPPQTGSYQGNWKIKNPKGELFGLGPGGNAPFWVRITVIEPDTPTLPPPPTPTSTPVIYVSGLVDSKPGDHLDLDTRQIVTGSTSDLLYMVEPDKSHRLTPENGARASQFGPQEPRISDCRSASLGAKPLILDTMEIGLYLCYRTNQGLPGWARLVALHDQDNTLTLEILTWSIP